MLKKPEACKGCPFWGSGSGFVPDEMREQATVQVVMQNPGRNEEVEGRPAIGAIGQAMDKDFLPLSGFNRDDVSICNAIRCRLNNSNELPPLHQTAIRRAIEHCTREHFRLGENVKLIVAQGTYALWAMTGEGGVKTSADCKIDNCSCKARTITAWRGYLLPFNPQPAPTTMFNDIWTPTPQDIPVLCTLHIGSLFKPQGEDIGSPNPGNQKRKSAPAMKVPMKMDWAKVALVLRRKWPVPLPTIIDDPLTMLSGTIAFDTEYDIETKYLLRYSAAQQFKTPNGLMVDLRVVERDMMAHPTLMGKTNIVMHNTPADLGHLAKLLDIDLDKLIDHITIDDTMYKHSVLWSDLDHDLNFLGSMYARTNRWKHLVHVNPRVYSGGDALGTLDSDLSLNRELGRDEGSAWVYRESVLPQAWVISKALERGLRINRDLAKEYLEALEAQRGEAERMAQASVGWPINLSSPMQVAKQLYDVEHVNQAGFGTPRNRR